MTQYVILGNGRYKYLREPSSGLRWRIGNRDDNWVVDAELSLGGFALTEDVGWRAVESGERDALSKVRWGARTTEIIDVDLTALGFLGTESTDEGATGDWIQING